MKLDLKINEQEKTIVFNGQEIKVRPYLLLSEINSIVEQMLRYDDYIQRMMVEDICLLRFCTDIEVNEKMNSDEYDLYKLSGIIDLVKEEIDERCLYMIDDCIYYEENINTTMKRFVKEMSEKFEENMDNFDAQKIMNSFVENMKKDIKK